MTAHEAMEIGMRIAEKHTRAVLDLYEYDGTQDVTIDQALKGAQVWLAAEIMRALPHDEK